MAIGMSFVGVGLTLVGAAGLAFGMVVQRYALSTCNRTVPVCGFEVHRLLAWALGLVLYALANGFYAVAQIFAPLSLLSGVFATLILFNLVFARLLLGEELTPPKVTGSFIIFVGVIMCIVSMATDAETEFTPSDIEDLLGRPAGLCWLLFLCGAVLSTMVAIGVHEWRYPVRFQSARLCRENKCVGDNAGPDPVIDEPHRLAPDWLERVMGVVYPASLGMDEAVTHLCMKAAVAMLSSGESCIHPVALLIICIWIATSLATVVYMKVVFERFETTLALPVEYGTVSAASQLSGLLFYRETLWMDTWQKVVILTGVVVIVVGVSVGRITNFQVPAWTLTAKSAKVTSKVSDDHVRGAAFEV